MSASITATVTESVSMQGAPFSSVSQDITGETAPIVETNIASGATATMTGIGSFAASKLQLLYLLADQVDCTVTFSDGTHSCTFYLTAGAAQLWFVGGGTNPLTAASVGTVTSMTVENMSTAGAVWNGSVWVGGVANAVATDFHARLIYSS